MEYIDFLKSKIDIAPKTGFKIDRNDLSDCLKPHQGDIVEWAILGGCRGIFAAFGLGKSVIQLEILRLINKKEGGKCLIIAPLGVIQEFKRDSETLIKMKIKFIKKNSDIDDKFDFYITNYEPVRDGKLDPNLFSCVTLDEGAVLRSYGSKTFQTFLQIFKTVKYRFVATATPSPNRYKELIHYAGFLGIMDTGQSLTRFFKRDSTQANNLTLLESMESKFWLWVSSWALFVQKPSDLGHSDDGYDLPALNVYYHKVTTDTALSVDRRGQISMFPDAALSLKDAAKTKRNTLPQRIEKMVDIINKNPDENILLWHDLEKERHAIKKAIPDSVDIYGSQKLELRESRVLDFSNGKIKYFATKPVLSGSGCNFQRYCNNAIFLGIGFKFADFIQAIHRIYRFLQTKECNIHIIYAETESEILKVLKKKWVNHERMVGKMSEIIKEYGLKSDFENTLTRALGIERIEVIGREKLYKAINEDSVIETGKMDENSIDLIHTSIPFANHYEYTPTYNDFGHTADNAQFWEQMDYLTPNLYKILRPGRIYACHVKDRILFGNVTGKGVPTVSPFHMETHAHTVKHGFDYLGMITVVTDVVRENNQTYRLGWTEQCKDGTKMGMGSPEYILIFRKPQTDRTKGYADVRVSKDKKEYTRAQWQVDAHAFWRSSGDSMPTIDEIKSYGHKTLSRVYKKFSLENIYNYEHHVKIGKEIDEEGRLPSSFMCLAPGSNADDVWTDVNRMLTLNGEQTRRKLNNHICPLQFDIVDRIIDRYSMAGETIFDPFAGLMTVPYRALLKGRKGIGCELNNQSFCDGIKYLAMAEAKVTMPTLFDLEFN